MNSNLSQNKSFVHPPLILINGFYNIPHAKYYYVFLGFVFVVSVLGNFFVMFIIYTERSFHTPKYMAVFHLVFIELCITTSLIPNLIVMFLLDSQYMSLDHCLAHLFFVYLFSCVEVLNINILAYDRLVAICLPLRYYSIITMSAIVVMLAVAWVISAISMMITFIFFSKFSFCRPTVIKKSYFCDDGAWLILDCKENYDNNIMSIVNMACHLFMPMGFNLLSYIFIGVALVKITTWEARFKALKTCSAHLMLVILRYTTAMGNYISAVTNTFNPNARIITMSLLFVLPPMVSPFIYVLNTDEIKEVSKRILKRKNTIEKTKNSDQAIDVVWISGRQMWVHVFNLTLHQDIFVLIRCHSSVIGEIKNLRPWPLVILPSSNINKCNLK